MAPHRASLPPELRDCRSCTPKKLSLPSGNQSTPSKHVSPQKAKAASPRVLDDGVAQLRAFLASKYALGRLHATEVAELALLITNLGVRGLSDLAYPDVGDNASRKIRAAFHMDEIESTFCKVEIPTSSEEGLRVFTSMPALSVQQVLFEEFLASPDMVEEAAGQMSTRNWQNNAVRMASNPKALCVPYGLFIDGAPYKGKGAGTRASLQSYYVNILGMPTRRVITCLQKDRLCGESCGCPCKGKCSSDALESFFVYHATWATKGFWAPEQMPGLPWENETAKHRGGTEVSFQGRQIIFILAEIRDDWDQYASTFGFPRHNQVPRFCPWCVSSREDMHRDPAPLFGHTEFMAEINRCLITVSVGRKDAEAIWESLLFDTRDKKSMQGRCIGIKSLDVFDLESASSVQLCKWDRVEAQFSVPDIHCGVSDLKPDNGVFKFVFWRNHPECRFRFLSVLFSIPGVLFDYCVIDDLHGLDLGPTQKLCGFAFVKALTSGVYGNATTENGMKAGCHLLSRDLKKWYSKFKLAKISRLGRVTLKMLQWFKKGDQGSLNCKGAEARGCLRFALALISRKKVQKAIGKDVGTPLRKAILALVRAYRLMRRSGRDIEVNQLGTCFSRVSKFSKKAGVNLTPKFHQMQHISGVAARAGNPRMCSAYMDESHNRFVVVAAQACFTKNFTGRILSREIVHLRALRHRSGRTYSFPPALKSQSPA